MEADLEEVTGKILASAIMAMIMVGTMITEDLVTWAVLDTMVTTILAKNTRRTKKTDTKGTMD